MDESWHEIELKKNLEFLGGTSDVDEYIQVACFRIGGNISMSKMFNQNSMCCIRNFRQCICSKKNIFRLYFIKRIGFLEPKYPYIMVGSRCITRFQTKHSVETLEGKIVNSYINCELCLKYFIKRRDTLCYDCRNFYTPNEILSIGKYQSKTFDYVYNNDENYCNFIVDKYSDRRNWKYFSNFIIGCREVEHRLLKKPKKNCVMEPLTTGEIRNMIKEDDWPLDKTYNLYTPAQMIEAFVKDDSTYNSPEY